MQSLQWILIILDILMLCLYFDDKCDQSFNIWLIFNVSGNFIQYLMGKKEFDDEETTKSKNQAKYFIGMALTIWLSVLYFSSTTCKHTTRHLYDYMTFYIIIYYIFYGLITLFFIIELVFVVIVSSCLCCISSFSICFDSRIEHRERRNYARELAVAARESVVEEAPILPLRNRLPTFKFSGLTNINNIECSICLSNYEDNDEVTKLGCEHNFHKECIEEWLHVNQTCPLCRTVVNDTV